MFGLGGAHHGTHAAERSTGGGQAPAEAVDDRRQLLVNGSLGSLEVLDVSGSRIACPDQREDSCPGRFGGSNHRFERIDAEQGIGREGVGAQAGNFAERRIGAAHHRLSVGLRRHRYVTALAVGDHEQSGGRGGLADLLEGAPAGPAQPLEAGELRLDAHTGGSGGADQFDAVCGD